MTCYIGRFRVPCWLYALLPLRLYLLADRLGGFE